MVASGGMLHQMLLWAAFMDFPVQVAFRTITSITSLLLFVADFQEQ